MSKITVFKFDVSDLSEMGMVHQAIGKYLNVRGFVYNREYECYETPDPNNPLSSGNVNDAVLNGVSSILVYKVKRGFKYIVGGDQITIETYIVDKNRKQAIHKNSNSEARSYYNDLNTTLFKELNYHKTHLISTDFKSINDGMGSSKSMLPLIIVLIALVIIAALIYFVIKGTGF